MKFKYILISTLFVLIFACKTNNTIVETNYQEIKIPKDSIIQKPEFKLGLEVLQQSNFELLKGKRVGLVTNPTGVDRKLNSTVDIFHENPNVNLVALFGPEHGVRGNFSAGDHVANNIDTKTGVPVFSLYGKNKKPKKEALDLVDVIVYDIQDIGVRSYTYISTMGLVMEAAAQFDKEVVVLDRPNPLGGMRVEGSLVKDKFYSFVSQYNIPYVYGLTCGELALMFNNEGLLADSAKCDLQVVKMEGWRRNMLFNETGLIWVPTSPHIPTWETAFYYAATGIIGELDPNLIGIGYTLPFQTLVTSTIAADKLCKAMNDADLEGVIFRPIFFKPYYMDKKGEELQGVQIHITDFNKVNLTDIQFVFIQESHKIDPTYTIFEGKKDRYRMFDLGCGSDEYRISLMHDFNYNIIKQKWYSEIDAFKKQSQVYYLYE